MNTLNFSSTLPQLTTTTSCPLPGYTPCLVTTLPNGQQSFQPLPPTLVTMQSAPIMASSPSPYSTSPMFVPMCYPSVSPVPFMLPSMSPLSLVSDQLLPNKMWFNTQIDTQVVAQDSQDDLLKIKLNDNSLKYTDYEDSGSSLCSYSRSASPSMSLEEFSIERPVEPKVAVCNENNVPLPAFTAEMTKKDLVNQTLDYLYEVFGYHFDTEGNRGVNVLRVKVKTRGALEHICVLVEKCVSEGLLSHISCPISTKKARQHIRGYLAYMEAVDSKAADRVTEIFEEYNASHLVEDSNTGKMEHPFKGISRNDISVRAKKE